MKKEEEPRSGRRKVRNGNLRIWLAETEHIIAQTLDHHEKDLFLWEASLSLWVDLDNTILFWLDDDKVDQLVDTSLVLNQLIGMGFIIRWSAVTVFSGAYHAALRNLRSLMEDNIQSLYLDQTMRDETITAKTKAIAILEHGRTNFVGSELIKKCDLPLEVKKALISDYSRLSKYVHPRRIVPGQTRSVFHYEHVLFLESLKLHRSVFDALLSLHLFHFRRVWTRAMCEYNEVTEFREQLQEAGFKIALSHFDQFLMSENTESKKDT